MIKLAAATKRAFFVASASEPISLNSAVTASPPSGVIVSDATLVTFPDAGAERSPNVSL